MDEILVARYWCHMCSRMVVPVMEEEIKCPRCDSGFVEEMEGGGRAEVDASADLASDRALSLWAPILLGMLGGGSLRRRRVRRESSEDGDEDSIRDREAEAAARRRRRNSAIIQLLQTIREQSRAESSENEGGRGRDRDRDRMILINPFNQTIILQGSFDQSDNQGANDGSTGISLGDYFLGPGLDLLLQHLSENDPNRYGTPPAQKEAVEAMPTVKIKENTNCSVCLDDFEIGDEAKEMPCKHKFHGGCILPWLELHSSCPVCRYQLPADQSKVSSATGNGDRVGGGGGGSGQETDGQENGGARASDGNRGRFWMAVPWPLNGLFSFLGSQGNDNSSSSSNSTSNSHNNEN